MLFKCKYVNNVPTVVPLANMSDNITDNASQVTITDTHGISGSVGAVTDLQTLTNTGSQKAMNNLAELMNDATAPKNYAVGDHILRNGQYSKVKQAIQQGGSFTSSNLEAACIGDELSSISSDLASKDVSSKITVSSGITEVSKTAVRSGNTIQVIIALKGTFTTSQVIATMSADIRPRNPFGVPLYNTITGVPINDNAVWLYDNGNIRFLGNNISTETEVRFSATYIV